MNEEFEKRIKQIEKNYEKEHNIFCPYCGTQQDTETMYEFVTMWGEEGFKKCWCEVCNNHFMVKERVDRTWESMKEEDYDDEVEL